MADATTAIEWTIKATDVAIVIATLLGPVLAVQAQKALERRREKAQRRAQVFLTLMTTRATSLSPQHVNALNAVPLEFYGTRGPLKEILDAWRAHLDHLGTDINNFDVWATERQRLFVDLLQKMAKYLGYDFNAVALKNEIYLPKAHAQLETEQEILRRGLLALLTGEKALPMEIRSWPIDREAAAVQKRAFQVWSDRMTPKRPSPPSDKP